MLDNVVLIHGYSVRKLDTYGDLPARLERRGFNANDIYLSAWDSLNDDITCTDIANALDIKLRGLEAAGLDVTKTAFITHSTGAIVFRRWLLTRWAKRQPLPSHFISLAGANHGSSLAELGSTELAQFYRWIDGNTSVGAEVLQDLDYGSVFLLALNEDWLNAYTSAQPPHTLCFSLGGDNHSGLENQFFWQSHENGCDTTVRVSGANLNYRFVAIDQTAPHPVPVVKKLGFTVPHLVIPGISHTGDNGIMGGNQAAGDKVFPFIEAALNIATVADYNALAGQWTAATEAWNAANPTQCNSTVVFSLTHPGGRNVKDSMIVISDQSPADGGLTAMQAAIQRALNVSSALADRQPMKNQSNPSSISFYVNYQDFVRTYPHDVQIIIDSGSPEITYPSARYEVTAGTDASIQPNETIYVKVTLSRQTGDTYSLIPASQNPNTTATFPPLPQPIP